MRCKQEPDPDTIKMFVGQVPRTMSEQELILLFQVNINNERRLAK